ncbi:TPA: hypothetical protein DEG21_05435 [Patescibacteria group bacterium]|nr:hypothetical protein [Candidatus Gracilibacteria bacterium]HBY75266.1 hypothetical protein [Candidatus Gracilibacteria bacterium]
MKFSSFQKSFQDHHNCPHNLASNSLNNLVKSQLDLTSPNSLINFFLSSSEIFLRFEIVFHNSSLATGDLTISSNFFQ